MQGYDDIVAFGNVLAKTVFFGSDEPMDSLLDYFSKPHKWDVEYQRWQELGGSLDKDCIDRFEFYIDRKTYSGECAKCDGRPSDSQHDMKHQGIDSHEFEEAE
jgi:hypothetical protein